MKKGIAIVGYNCIDWTVTPAEQVAEGEISAGARILWSIGGIGGNTGSILAQMGDEVHIVGRIPKKDAMGQAMRYALEQTGAQVHFVEDPNFRFSGTVVTETSKDRTFQHQPGSNLGSRAEDLNEEVIHDCCHAHIGYFGLSPHDLIEKTLLRARINGLTTSFDTHGKPTSQDMPSFKRCARLTDVLIPSYNEIAGLFGASDEDLRDKRLNPKTMCQYLTTLGPEVVGVKLGSDGAILMDRTGQWIYSPVFEGVVKKRTGAGDTFYAGVISEYMNRKRLGKPLNLATMLTKGNIYATMQVCDLPKDYESFSEVHKRAQHQGQTKWQFN